MGQHAVVKKLLALKGNCLCKTKNGLTALHMAALNG
jgi:ankyrin repeat protein